jgi:hypothetical protein
MHGLFRTRRQQEIASSETSCGMQESIVNSPPRCLGLGLIHAVAPLQDSCENNSQDFQFSHQVSGYVYIHTPVSLADMQLVTKILVGMWEVPVALISAPGMCSPYVALCCLPSDAGGGGVMRSRRNLARVSQA